MGLVSVKRLWGRARRRWRLWRIRLSGPPRVLAYDCATNAAVLRMFGATVGTQRVRIHGPITLHEAEGGYHHLSIADGCIINGNNYFDLSERITLEEGVSIGPGVTIMTHNRFNYNTVLEERLASMCGKKPVLIKRGAGIKAGALITMGVTIGENAVVAGQAVVNRDVEPGTLVGGVPMKTIKRI